MSRIGREINDFVAGFKAGSDVGFKKRYYDYLATKGQGGQDQGAIDARSNAERDPAYMHARPPAGGGGEDHGSGSLQFNDKHKALMGVLIDRGVKPEVAAGAVGSMMGESGRGLNTEAYNPNDNGGPSGGLAQWHNERFGDLVKFAGLTPDQAVQGNRFLVPFDKQKDFLGHELDTTYGGVLKALRNAKTTGDGNRIWTKGFEVPDRADEQVAKRAGYGDRLWGWYNENQPKMVDAPVPPRRPDDLQAVPANVDAGTETTPTPTAALEPDFELPQWGSRGGMIKRYANGGAVVRGAVPAYQFGGPVDEDDDPNDEDDLLPTQASYTRPAGATPAGSFLDVLPEAVKGGLQGLQEMFGLDQQGGAIPQANGGFMDGVKALFSGQAAADPQELQAVTSKVDPEGKLDTGMRNIAGLTAVYEYHATKGDYASARKAAAGLLQAMQVQTQRLGGLAAEAVRNGDTTAATKALVAAYNSIPNGKRVTVEGDNAVVTDEKTGKQVDQFKLTPQVLLQAATQAADGSAYYNQLMATAAGKPAYVEPEPDPAFENYVSGKGAVSTAPTPAPSGTTPKSAPSDATSTPAPTQAAVKTSAVDDEEDMPSAQFTPKTPRPEIEPEPTRPDLAGMKDKQHRIAAGQDYNAKYREWSKRKADAESKYKADVTLEKKQWDDEQKLNAEQRRAVVAVAKQRRHDEAKGVGTAYDDWTSELEGAKKPAPPPELAGRIKDIGQHLVESNDLHARNGIIYANEIANPASKIKLEEKKSGGTITMSDGETFNLTPRAFRTVKRMRDGYDEIAKKKAEEANQPSALGTIGEGISGWANHTAKRWGDVGRKLGVTREAVSLNSER